MCALWVAKDSNLLKADSVDFDQTGRMPESSLGAQALSVGFVFSNSLFMHRKTFRRVLECVVHGLSRWKKPK